MFTRVNQIGITLCKKDILILSNWFGWIRWTSLDKQSKYRKRFFWCSPVVLEVLVGRPCHEVHLIPEVLEVLSHPWHLRYHIENPQDWVTKHFKRRRTISKRDLAASKTVFHGLCEMKIYWQHELPERFLMQSSIPSWFYTTSLESLLMVYSVNRDWCLVDD